MRAPSAGYPQTRQGSTLMEYLVHLAFFPRFVAFDAYFAKNGVQLFIATMINICGLFLPFLLVVSAGLEFWQSLALALVGYLGAGLGGNHVYSLLFGRGFL